MDIIILFLILEPKTRSIEIHMSNINNRNCFIYITKYIVSILVNGHHNFPKIFDFFTWYSIVNEIQIHQVMCHKIFDLIYKKNMKISDL